MEIGTLRCSDSRVTHCSARLPVWHRLIGVAPVCVNGLTNSTTYSCQVRTTTTAGVSDWSVRSATFTPTEAPVTYFHNDISGSPMLATDATGKVVWKENYHPYGERLNKQTGSDSNNKLWFAGKPFDAATGLTYMGARYYDPMLGRFMGVDPVDFRQENIHSFNRYAYANNNPYRYVDPDGREDTPAYEGQNGSCGGVSCSGSTSTTTSYWRPLTGRGHHIVPNEVVKKLGITSTPALEVFDSKEARIPVEGHDGSRPSPNGITHQEYNKQAILEAQKWIAENKIDPSKMSSDQARAMLQHFKSDAPAPIRQFNMTQYGKAFSQALRKVWFRYPYARGVE